MLSIIYFTELHDHSNHSYFRNSRDSSYIGMWRPDEVGGF